MEKEEKSTNVELNRELFKKMSYKLTEKIAQARQDIDDMGSIIQGNKEYLEELRAMILNRRKEIKKIRLQIKNIKLEIKDERVVLRENKKQKFSLVRKLHTYESDDNKLKKLYINRAPTIDTKDFHLGRK